MLSIWSIEHTILIQPTNGKCTAMDALLYSASSYAHLRATDLGLSS